MSAVRIGLLGAGSMGRAHATAIAAAEGAEFVAVHDPDGVRAAAVARDFGVPTVAGDLAELLDAGVDAVVVATPEAMHLDPVVASLDAGKHVLVEKPLTTDAAEAHQIADAAQRAGTVVIPGYNLRYDSRHREIKEWIEAGRAGTLTSLALRRNRSSALFSTYQRVHPGFESTSHDIDLALWFTGSRIRTVFAKQRQRPGDANPFGLWALLELEDGTVVTTEAVWSVPPAVPVPKADLVEVVGERGTAHVDVAGERTVLWDDRGITELHRPLLTTPERPFVSIDAEIADFVACAAANRPSKWASLADAVHAVDVVTAMIRSAQSGAPVAVGGA